jgi:RecJ-like exonuclease
MSANYKSKYHIGQEVWLIFSKEEDIPCPACQGKKKIKLDKMYECPNCYGYGTDTKDTYSVGKSKVIGVSIHDHGDKGMSVFYSFINASRKQEHVFETKKEATDKWMKKSLDKAFK